MLALDDPRWAELSHSYGSGESVPQYLKKIERSAQLPDDYMRKFGGTLCGQCDSGSASVAAFPHLVRLADLKRGSELGLRCLDIASAILSLELGPSNRLDGWERVNAPYPKYLLPPFGDAIKTGQALISQLLFNRQYNYNEMIGLLAYAAAFAGHADISMLLPKFANHSFDCPECEAEIDTERMYTF